MNEDFIDLVRMSVLAYLGREDDDGDCRGGLITLLELEDRYDGSNDFLELLDACLKVGVEWELEPPWDEANVYGFVDIDETVPPMPAWLIQTAFSTLELDDEIILIIQQLPSNRLNVYRGVPTRYQGYRALFFDGEFCWLTNGREQAVA